MNAKKGSRSKKPAKVGAAEVPEVQPESAVPEMAAPAEDQAPEVATSRARATKGVATGAIRVTLKDGSGRIYSFKSHGKHFETLAKQFAEHNDGKIG